MGREEPVDATPASNLHALHAKSMRETKGDCFTLFSNIGFIYIKKSNTVIPVLLQGTAIREGH